MTRTSTWMGLSFTAALLAAAGATFAAHPPGPFGGKAQLEALSGTYRSTDSEDWGRGTFGRREFTFDKGRWALRFTLALDRDMRSKVFEFRTEGAYRVLDPSRTVQGAHDALFYEETKHLTLRTSDPNLVGAFGLAACGLVPDVEKDISSKGCSRWKAVSICGEDHDLLAIDTSGALYFGTRPADNDMCTAEKRPTALLPAVVKQ